jgi:hypothetical protein
MTENLHLVAFKAISNFVNDLNDVFGKDQKSLTLYSRLISKTTLSHADAIEKHVNAFKSFCISNREVIQEKNYEELENPTILYSSRVFIDLKHIFKIADAETRDVIWNHILAISAILDPASCAKEILKKSIQTTGDSSAEENFLTGIMTEIESQVQPDTDPNQAIASILSSGMIPKLVNSLNEGMSSGQLDLSKMMNSVQKIIGGANLAEGGMPGIPGGGNLPDMMNMITSMMGSLNKQ